MHHCDASAFLLQICFERRRCNRKQLAFATVKTRTVKAEFFDWALGNAAECLKTTALNASGDVCQLFSVCHLNHADTQQKKSHAFAHDFYGADNQIRTGDLVLTKDVLYLLSHISTFILLALI